MKVDDMFRQAVMARGPAVFVTFCAYISDDEQSKRKKSELDPKDQAAAKQEVGSPHLSDLKEEPGVLDTGKKTNSFS